MKNKFLSLLLLIITFSIGFNIVIVKEKDEFSITENRELSQIEQISLRSLTTGLYQESVENTLADHFLGREHLVKVYNSINLTLNKFMNKIGEIAFGLSFNDQIEVAMINENISLITINEKKRLVRNSIQINQETTDYIKNKIELLNNYNIENLSVNFYSYFVISPHHSNLIYHKYNIDNLIPVINTLNFPVDFFEIMTAEDIEKYFYATDHHWNHLGSYKGYKEIAELMLIEKKEILRPKDLICFEEVKFWGSHSRRIAHSVEIGPDDICKYIFELPQYSLYINGVKKNNYGNFNDYLSGAILDKNEKGFDHYNYINQSRKAVIKFDTKRDNLDNLLVISDSMSNPIRELIAAHYNKSMFINLDLYNTELGKFEMNQYIKDNDIDNVLIFLSIDNLLPGGEIKHLSE